MEKSNVKYRGWMGEQIAKTYLLETNLIEVYESEKSGFDFLCIFKDDFKKVFAVEIKSSQYKKSDLLRKYKKQRHLLAKKQMVCLLFYIDYVDKTGYFETIYSQLTNELLPLNTESLRQALRNISFA